MSDSEQLDLLIKWSGSKSSDHLRKIKAVHINDPGKGLLAAWGRLEEKFGESDVVALNILATITNFPKIGRNQHERLLEFSDNLQLIKYAK